jgi:methylthioribose-1-phosphate isomerase
MAIAAHEAASSGADPAATLRVAEEVLAASRPTAVNLFWALERCQELAGKHLKTGGSATELAALLSAEAIAIHEDDIARNRKMGEFGAALLPKGARILTHCNAGALATGGHGTALGIIRSAVEAGKEVEVWVDETRPYLQGARLTLYELMAEEIPARLVSDNMAGFLMSRDKVDVVIVGADRTVANGDVANKIGTYTLAVLCARHKIPFYVACPLSTLDLSIATGADIPIEERSPDEVTHISGVRIAPEGAEAYHPAFDVTPAELVTAIITEKGIAYPPYNASLPLLLDKD